MDSSDVRRTWAERSGEYSPEYYAYYGPDDRSDAVRQRFDRFLARDDSILELGCSSGRHLAHLKDHGFDSLTGIEINGDAFDVMAETYPDLADEGTFFHGPIEAVVDDFDDGQFDAVYSVETLQHLHPDHEWVFAELARITDDLLVTIENEGKEEGDGTDDVTYVTDDVPLYYRDWNLVFTERGLVEVDVERHERDTVRVFRWSDE